MKSTELIAYLRNHPLVVCGESWQAEHVSRGNCYAQYKRRFPSDRNNSLHYEVERRDDVQVNIVLHCESATERRQGILERLGWERGNTDSRLYVEDCSSYDVEQIDVLIAEISSKMSLIAERYEPRIRKIEEEWSSIPVDTNGTLFAEENYDVRVAGYFEKKSEELPTDTGLRPDAKAEVVLVSMLLRERLGIPNYQRPYKWSERSVLRLLTDMEDAAKHPECFYRVGTVILLEKDGKHYIVDGQQRVMTLALLSLALGCGFMYGDDAAFFAPFAESIVSLKVLKRNFAVIDNYVRSLDLARRDQLCHVFLRQLEVVVLKVSKESEAFQLFDCQNTRGRRLDPQDLLKAFHLREVDCPELRKECADQWELADKKSIDAAVGRSSLMDRVGNRELFNSVFYRIHQWLRGVKPGEFTEQELDLFKGVPKVDAYAYVRSAKRRIIGEGDPEYQIDEPFYPGKDFFLMVEAEREKLHALRRAIATDPTLVSIRGILEEDDGSQAHKNCRSLFYAAAILYYDRFSNTDRRALERICAWAFLLRLDLQRVQDKSAVKYALGNDDVYGRYTNHLAMFSVIKEARHHSEIANLVLAMPPVRSGDRHARLRENVRKMLGI